MRKKLTFGIRAIVFSLLTVLCYLLSSCGLFNNMPEVDLEKKMDEAIAWANAAKLTITMAAPQGWINSSNPPAGTITTIDIRQGFAFSVECDPSAGYGFEQWLAFYTSDFASLDFTLSASDTGIQQISRRGRDVIITDEETTGTGLRKAKIIIDTTMPVIVVPWCSPRPQVIQSNPPLINSGSYYNRGQEIRMWFSTDLVYDEEGYRDNEEGELAFGEDTIQISGQYIDSGAAWTGDGKFTDFFRKPVYDSATRTITIAPEPDNPPPGYLAVTVSAGTGIIGANGGNAVPVAFSYRTNDEIVSKAYKAGNVWAIHDPDNYPGVASFFYQMAPEDRDRRLRKNNEGEYQVTLYYSVSRSVGEIEDPQPNSLTIAEIRYADLAGVETVEGGAGWSVRETEMELTSIAEDRSIAGTIYKQMNTLINPLGVSYYKTVYTFDSGTEAGIIRLAVLPYHTGMGNSFVEADSWKTAVDEGRFVTVVLDDKAPDGSGTLTISGHSSRSTGQDGLNIYTYNNINKSFVMSADFSGIHDNGNAGILPNQAYPDKPWTMDEQRNLQWQWRIADSDETRFTSAWIPMGTDPQPFDLSTIVAINSEKVWNIEIHFKDALGNENSRIMAKIRYIKWEPYSSYGIITWSASYNETANTIQINWVKPASRKGVQIKVFRNGTEDLNETEEYEEDVLGRQSHTVSSVPKLGTPYSSTEYRIELRTYNESHQMDDALTLKIWNIPGMTISEEDLLEEITDDAGLEALQSPANSYKQFILSNDIDLYLPWIPAGSGSTPFRGKLYGNGKTINLHSGIVNGYESTGFFGSVQDTLIRDLRLLYLADVNAVTPTAAVGGLAAYAGGACTIINTTVQGADSSTLLSLTRSTDTDIYLGGMFGNVQGQTVIVNCRTDINLNCVKTGGGGSVYSGGFAGSLDVITVEGCLSTGAVSTNSGAAQNNSGGFAGSVAGSVKKCGATGDVDAAGGNEVRAGGLVGNASSSIEQSCASGNVFARRTAADASGASNVSTGGLVGYSDPAQATITNCYAAGDVTAHNEFPYPSTSAYTHLYTGGLVGYANGNVKYGFAKGNVEARNVNFPFTYAGGVAGIIHDHVSLNYTVALGDWVRIATGYVPSSNYCNRVYGYAGGWSGGSYNYAKASMQTGGNWSNTTSPLVIPISTSTVSGGTATNENGANIPVSYGASAEYTQAFWTSTIQFNSSAAGTGIWDITNVATEGHPRLAWE